AIHVGGRLEQCDVATAVLHTADIAEKFRMTAKAAAEFGGQRIHQPEPRVVAREQMLRAGVAEADDDFEGRTGHSSSGKSNATTAQRPGISLAVRRRDHSSSRQAL